VVERWIWGYKTLDLNSRERERAVLDSEPSVLMASAITTQATMFPFNQRTSLQTRRLFRPS